MGGARGPEGRPGGSEAAPEAGGRASEAGQDALTEWPREALAAKGRPAKVPAAKWTTPPAVPRSRRVAVDAARVTRRFLESSVNRTSCSRREFG